MTLMAIEKRNRQIVVRIPERLQCALEKMSALRSDTTSSELLRRYISSGIIVVNLEIAQTDLAAWQAVRDDPGIPRDKWNQAQGELEMSLLVLLGLELMGFSNAAVSEMITTVRQELKPAGKETNG